MDEKCELCGGTTWIFYTDDRGYEFAKPCKCRQRVISNNLLSASGISYADSKKGFNSFETFNEKDLVEAKATAVNYFKEFKDLEDKRNNSILICGSSGRGKTTLGLAITNNLINSNIQVRYMPYRDVITSLKQHITAEGKEIYNDTMFRLQNARVLFIDDLLKGKVTESDINIMFEIINYRYLQKKPVIVSTEKTIEELLEFDEAIGSRLIEMSKGHIITFGDNVPNYRLR